ncbi:endonuclease [Clostridium sp. DJ247]|uniref:endonuclease n=1 Tax=Clostridium sp. DJ247 TaxID=2726188 RepID=UPI0028BEE0DB|nr:endonuclease [Clostridium sp. DJ247]
MISNCGKGEVEKFEPESGKGEAARAVLYFLLRYPGKIKEDRKNRINIDLLLKWHKEFPVSLYEKHRNKAIYELQGNRNPLIDFPQCADSIDFSFGLT